MTIQVPFDQDELFIGGSWVRPVDGQATEVVSPSTEKPIGSVVLAGPADVDAAVAAANRALPEWSARPPEERATLMERLAELLAARGNETAELVSHQNGMPVALSRQLEAVFPAAFYSLYAGLARTTPVASIRGGLGGGRIEVRRAPVGVVAAIVPWNFPQNLAASKIAPALAAGCTVVVKPSPETSLDSVILAEAIMESGIPAGVVNIVPGDAEVGRYLVSHPGVHKVAFTGWTAAGREIAERCGAMLRPVSLELGGKSAAIVLDDADLSGGAAESMFGATLLNNGQTCFLGTRILAPRARYDEVVEFLGALAAGAPVGDPLDESTLVGPLVSARQRDRVEGYIASAKADGSRLVTGGGRPDRAGYYVEPTVFADVANDQRLAQEEVFGPVLAVIPYGDDDEAVAIANDSTYGLGGSVWSADPERAHGVACRVATGTIGINGYFPDLAAPFGGVKGSGLGREFGPEALDHYVQLQSVYL